MEISARVVNKSGEHELLLSTGGRKQSLQVLSLSAAHMKEYSPGAPAVDRGHKDDGAVIFLPIGPPHQMENLETGKPLKAIRVELKKGCLTGAPKEAGQRVARGMSPGLIGNPEADKLHPNRMLPDRGYCRERPFT